MIASVEFKFYYRDIGGIKAVLDFSTGLKGMALKPVDFGLGLEKERSVFSLIKFNVSLKFLQCRIHYYE